MRLLIALALLPGLAAGAAAIAAQGGDAGQTRATLQQVIDMRRLAQARSERLEREAAAASDAADKAAREAAALAARIQQAELGIAAAQERATAVARERAALREALGQRQKPVVKLTAALQQFSRRPVALAMLRPGSIKDVVHLRAVMSTAIPQVQARTADLRGSLGRSRALRTEAIDAARALRAEEIQLNDRRTALSALEARQRVAFREAQGNAAREAERALALGEQARDLDALVDELDRAGSLRETLAALPGPLLRPDRPEEARAQVPDAAASPVETLASGPPRPFLLPVAGRTVTGFGVASEDGTSRGITLAPRAGAQVVAPAQGRVAFAGAYRGYGRIVIIEHPGGWTSLVTGLAQTTVEVGDRVVGGAPLGQAGGGTPAITLELRHGGEPVNPLPFVG